MQNQLVCLCLRCSLPSGEPASRRGRQRPPESEPSGAVPAGWLSGEYSAEPFVPSDSCLPQVIGQSDQLLNVFRQSPAGMMGAAGSAIG